MPSTRRYLCEDEKDDVKECLFAQKRVSCRSMAYQRNLPFYFLSILVSSSTIHVSAPVNTFILYS
jgi:hypothetical protein